MVFQRAAYRIQKLVPLFGSNFNKNYRQQQFSTQTTFLSSSSSFYNCNNNNNNNNNKYNNNTIKMSSSKSNFSTSSSDNDDNDEVIFEEKNGIGYIILNRPKALNALNLNMCRMIQIQMDKWSTTTTTSSASSPMKCIIMKGTGGKAFCAGGDVVTMRNSALHEQGNHTVGKGERNVWTSDFFREEYTLNYTIGNDYPIPQISIWNGIVMGGGVGVSVHGRYRIATENSMFAMPETGIGLFPDVGGTFFLSRLPLSLGLYYGLTGYRLKGADLLYSGIATHYIESEKLEHFETDLHKEDIDIDGLLNTYSDTNIIKESKVANLQDKIDKYFTPSLGSSNNNNGDGISEIMEHLQKDAEQDEWCAKTLKILLKCSPSSLEITYKAIVDNHVLQRSLKEALMIEYRLANACMREPDFCEGIRALLVDKDNMPKWSPSTVQDFKVLSNTDKFFKSLGDNELILP